MILRVRFLDGHDLAARVMAEAAVWTRHANLEFQVVDSGPAEIRVTFRGIGNWLVLENPHLPATDAAFVRAMYPGSRDVRRSWGGLLRWLGFSRFCGQRRLHSVGDLPIRGETPMRKHPDEPAVEDLARAAMAGQSGAWDQLVDRYDGMLRAVVAGFRLREADAADAIQMTWLRAVEQIGSLRRPERFGGWLKMIVFRECLNLREFGRREFLDPQLAEHVVEPAPGPEAEALRAELRRSVRAAVDTLTGRNRAVIEVLFYRPTMDYAAVASEAGMPHGSIGPTRARAFHAVRQHLVRTGFLDPFPDSVA